VRQDLARFLYHLFGGLDFMIQNGLNAMFDFLIKRAFTQIIDIIAIAFAGRHATARSVGLFDKTVDL
jgi:hypothetical protein